MKNKGLFFVLFLLGIVVYYGLLVIPPRITVRNIILFVVYLSAATFLIMKKGREGKDKKD